MKDNYWELLDDGHSKISPPPAKNRISSMYNNKLIINGGYSDFSNKVIQKLYDTWEFDIINKEWREIVDGNNIFLCQAKAASDIEINTRSLEKNDAMEIKQFPCRVKSYEKLNESVLRIILELPKTESLQFLPGQYIDFILPEGKRRSFSLANPPHQDQTLELHVRYYDGGIFSEYAFNELKNNTLMKIEGPLGQFTLHNSERPIIMIAGGTGFAPIKSIIEHALKINDPRTIHFYWGARLKNDLYLDNIVIEWVKKFPHIAIFYDPYLTNVSASSPSCI